ncbi:hypothetical protein CIK65_00840 [Brevibacterium aurantiacum]|uniref:Uncharacterized protein n=1 Tax=Brevibacterium aurantiacum TaxID=273384 RepID=A0A2A3YZM1_BREAU|nr:hypothetical protein CIK65_00840 [Brevibacterium aurantiacum]
MPEFQVVAQSLGLEQEDERLGGAVNGLLDVWDEGGRNRLAKSPSRGMVLPWPVVLDAWLPVRERELE